MLTNMFTFDIFSEANAVVNRLTHLDIIDDVWLVDTFAIIQDILYKDISHIYPIACSFGLLSSRYKVLILFKKKKNLGSSSVTFLQKKTENSLRNKIDRSV